MAQRRDGLPERADDLEPLAGELELLGFIGIADSARPDALNTVQVMVTSVASFAALVAVVQTLGLSQFLGCTPLGPVAWGIVLTAAAAGSVVAVKRGGSPAH